jgi:hypothetical protein
VKVNESTIWALGIFVMVPVIQFSLPRCSCCWDSTPITPWIIRK